MFGLFKQIIQFLQQINVKNVQMSIQYMAPRFEPMIFKNESSPITTRPGLPPRLKETLSGYFFFTGNQRHVHGHCRRFDLRGPPPAEDRGLNSRGRTHSAHHLLHRGWPPVHPDPVVLQAWLGRQASHGLQLGHQLYHLLRSQPKFSGSMIVYVQSYKRSMIENHDFRVSLI